MWISHIPTVPLLVIVLEKPSHSSPQYFSAICNSERWEKSSCTSVRKRLDLCFIFLKDKTKANLTHREQNVNICSTQWWELGYVSLFILISLKYHVIKNLEIKCETKYITSNTVLNIYSRLIITLSIFIQGTSIHKNINNDAVYK